LGQVLDVSRIFAIPVIRIQNYYKNHETLLVTELLTAENSSNDQKKESHSINNQSSQV
jgi:hypothetical protein